MHEADTNAYVTCHSSYSYFGLRPNSLQIYPRFEIRHKQKAAASASTVTISSRLNTGGYLTFLSGNWHHYAQHLAPSNDNTFLS